MPCIQVLDLFGSDKIASTGL